MKPYKMFVASTGVLLTSALALASLAACGGAEPAPERGRDRSVELPAGEPQPLDECQPGEEYTSGGVLCGDGNWEVEIPIDDDPPMCEALPGGCFPDDEDPYPWEPPPPPDTGGGGEPPPPPPPPPPAACTQAGNDCSTGQACCGPTVCQFGGERDAPWCQNFVEEAWNQSCVRARNGTNLYRNGIRCQTVSSSEGPFKCREMAGTSCIVAYTGACGDGVYYMSVTELVQTDPGSCN